MISGFELSKVAVPGMAELLITGGAGFIGSHFSRYWRIHRPHDRLVVLDALTYAGDRQNLAGIEALEFVHGDIRDTALVSSLLETRRIDTIVNFAAETHVDRSIANPSIFFDVNVYGTLALLDAAKQVWLDRGAGRPHRFHQISTDEVFGSIPHDARPVHELAPYAPNSPYAASKAAADHLVRAYQNTYGLQATITHSSNNFGPRQHPEKLIPLCITNALHGRHLPIYGTGSNIRQWIPVEDTCRAVELVLTSGAAGETYNIGPGREMRNIDLVTRLCDILDVTFSRDETLRNRFPLCPAAAGRRCRDLIRMVADRLGHDHRYALDCGKIGSQLGFVIRGDWEDQMDAAVRWYQAHSSR